MVGRGGELRIFSSPRAYMKGGVSLEFFHVPEPIWECRIEHTWLGAKIRMLKKLRGDLQSHLDPHCWTVMRKQDEDMFLL